LGQVHLEINNQDKTDSKEGGREGGRGEEGVSFF
jgi:hypothetical protein